MLDVYSSVLYGSNAAALITPEPRVTEDHIVLAGEASRVTWWVPGIGDRHPAMLVVNGASPVGNDDSETRRICEALARAGYLVMLPEYAFLKDARFERSAPERVDAAFALLLRRSDADPEHAGAFGFSVGGGILFAAAGSPNAALRRARYVGALGAYFDIRTYLAAVVSGTQMRNGRAEKWTLDPEARLKIPIGAAQALSDPGDRDAVIAALRANGGVLAPDPPPGLGSEARALWLALTATDYDTALARIDLLPASLGETIAALSPATRWSELRTPVYWLHDEGDRFEPVSEAERASAVPHGAVTRLQLTRLLSHAAALGPDAQRQGPDFLIRELAGLLGFAFDVLKRAG
ncbi:MAG: hypothetical protein AUH85_09290 [Chloroflexi bacterium 13_1_40CM_4_68_4]|nr:MAG: hypothetical protein AUH85_09290 [Chloroflexi bacterium 13_1_40CM_4_68_4]